MSSDEIKYLPFEEALNIVAAIQEEEDIERANKRILTVYNQNDKEVCWFDYDELMEELTIDGNKPSKEVVQDYILHHLPEWANEI